MKTRLILKAGQPGTKSLVKKYGEALLCVRFKYDARTRQRIKTIELVIEKKTWTPPKRAYAADTLVPLRIEPYDMPMRQQAKAAGGRWNPEKRRWLVKFGKIAGTQLEKHIQVDET